MALQDIGSNIRSYMKLAGLTIPVLAERSGLSIAALSKILNGKAEPRSSSLLQISDALKVSIEKLLSDGITLKTLRFRELKTMSGREKAASDIIVREVGEWLRNYRELEEMLESDPPRPLLVGAGLNPEEASLRVRADLGIPEGEPVADITSVLASRGIKLFIRDFGFRQTFGMSAGVADGGPAIVVNSTKGISIERQIFTAAHELGHLILHPESYKGDLSREDEKEEAEANAFAGYFLMPRERFRKEWNAAGGLFWAERVLRIKKIFKVSYGTVIRRLCDDDQYHAGGRNLSAEFATWYNMKYQHDLKNHYEPDSVGSLGYDFSEDRFSFLVRQSLERGEISSGRAAELLGMSLEEMRTLIASWQEL